MKQPTLINLPKYLDPRGNLSYVEEDSQLPFKFKRVYWIYDVPGGEVRGGHAFKETEVLIIALSGSFDLVLKDGEREYRYSLNRSYFGVYVPPMIWSVMENFSTNSLAVIISSTEYNPNDYIRDYYEYMDLKTGVLNK